MSESMPMSPEKVLVIPLLPTDQHDRVMILFKDTSEDEEKLVSVSVLWLLHNGPPYNSDTKHELEYVSTNLIH